MFSSDIANFMKAMCPEGTRVQLISMANDPHSVDSGMRGTVRFIDDMGTFHVDWDNGRTLGIVPGEDDFRALNAQEIAEEQAKSIVME